MKKLQIALFTLLALATAITVGCGDSASLPIFKQMAFLSNRTSDPSTPLFLMNVDGSSVVPVATTTSDLYSPSISANGKTVVFTSDGNVWTSDAAGAVQTQLTTDNNSWEAKISPDGSKILFNDWDSTNEVYNLWLMKADGTGATNLTSSLSANGGCYSGSFSADSKKIVFSCYTSELTTIYSAKADGTGQTTVFSQSEYCDTPSFSPDGKQVFFISFGLQAPGLKKHALPPARFRPAKGIHANGSSATTYGLVSVNADGSNLTTLVVGAYEVEVLNATVYYTVYNSDLEASQIFMSNLDGSGATALTDGSSYSYIGTSTD